MRLVIALAAVVAVSTTANAATFGGQAKTVPVAFTAKLTTVCQSTTLILTSGARAACAQSAFPRLVASGTTFVNMGTGAELNTLMRQVPSITTASK